VSAQCLSIGSAYGPQSLPEISAKLGLPIRSINVGTSKPKAFVALARVFGATKSQSFLIHYNRFRQQRRE
jgi:hypothetical protein